MGALNLAEWQKLPVSLSELCINTTLRCGQSFRWRKNDAGVWSIALHNRILSVHQDREYLYYRSIRPSNAAATTTSLAPPTPPSSTRTPEEQDKDVEDDTLALIQHYFNLHPNLTALYAEWSAADPNFAKKAPQFTGVRILRQDAWEALIGFICSSNNNIARIAQMVHKLCIAYGPLLGHLRQDDEAAESDPEGQHEDSLPYHDFPRPEDLAQDGVEAQLRALGFGYRAKYIHQTARLVAAQPPGWLDGLRNPTAPAFGQPEGKDSGAWSDEGREGYRAAHEALLTLQGVGPKVADCVCLMGLGWGEAVPVDTHVWQIAQRDYKFGKGKHASLTKATYDAVAAKFRSLWGQEAGWAHSVLFTADLKAFSERLVAKKEVVKEEVVVAVKKEEEDDAAAVEAVLVKTERVAKRAIKRERVEEDTKVLEVEQTVSRSKRRRTRT